MQDIRPFLHAAATGDTTSIAQQYQDTPSLLTAQDPHGSTALHLAVLSQHLDAVRLLLQYGVSTSTANNTGQTPLHLAAQGCSTDIVEALLQHGTPCSARDHIGKTAMAYAYQNPCSAILSRFLDFAPTCGGGCTLTPEIVLNNPSPSSCCGTAVSSGNCSRELSPSPAHPISDTRYSTTRPTTCTY
ncbi:ankyrin repeat-containing domain protein [Aspergillus egyptiacus]|nr:ankyrin repeat-containing domain protein [Aspergillus egyptiacus]